MGLFTVGAKVASARRIGIRQSEQDALERQRREEEEQQREIQRAATLSSMRNAGIIPEGERENGTLELPGLSVMANGKMRGTHEPSTTVDSGAPDPTRYHALGNTGYVQDQRKTPEYLEQRKMEKQETEYRRRMASLRARNPLYKDKKDEELRGVVTDDDTFRDAMKPVVPTIRDTNVVNPSAGTVEDVYSDGSRKVVRRATPEELEKAKHVPRDTNDPPPQRPLDAATAKEKAADDLAYSAIEGAHGDLAAALAQLNKPGEHERAKQFGVTWRHLEAAKQRYDDRLTSKTKPEQGSSIADIVARANGGGAKPAPTSKPTGSSPTAAPTAPAKQVITAEEKRELIALGYTEAQITAKYTVKP